MVKITACVTLFLFVLVCCCQAQQPSQVGNSIHGTVTDADTGQPIQQFRVIKGTIAPPRGSVRFNPETSLAFRAGQYDYPFPARIPSGGGAAVLRFEADGYLPEQSPPVRVTPVGIEDTTFHIKLRKSAPLKGTVQLPDGAAAAGADICLVSPGLPLALENNQLKISQVRAPQAGVRSAKTDAGGAFTVERDTPDTILLVMHDLGAILIKDPAVMVDGMTIKLEPWSTVSGKIAVGNKPPANQIVGMTIEAAQVRLMPITMDYTTNAAADGQFSFDRVFPGHYAIERVAPNVREGLIMQELASYAPVVATEAGKTTRVDMTNSGRKLVGKATIEGEEQARTLAPVAVRIYTARIEPKNQQETDAWLATRRIYTADLLPDGSFSLDAIEPGHYTIQLRGVPDAVGDPRLGGRPAIRDYVADFTVPPSPNAGSTDTLDLGKLRFHPPVQAR